MWRRDVSCAEKAISRDSVTLKKKLQVQLATFKIRYLYALPIVEDLCTILQMTQFEDGVKNEEGADFVQWIQDESIDNEPTNPGVNTYIAKIK